MSYAKKEDAQGMGYVDEGGEIPSTDRMREMLARNQASSSLAQGAGGSAEEQMDPRAQLQKQLDKANHYMLVEILPEVISFDIGCFGLTTCLTLPLVYWPIAAIWGLEVYNDYTGNSTPLTPKLSWKSFFPPGTEMDIPLPNPPLWIAWIMYVILLVFATVIWGTMIFLLVYTISDPAAALSGLGEIFPFMTSIIGI